jgi:hypothetical protein
MGPLSTWEIIFLVVVTVVVIAGTVSFGKRILRKIVQFVKNV